MHIYQLNGAHNFRCMWHTCWEYKDCILPQSSLLQSQSDVAHRFVHCRHHSGVQPAQVVLDETVRGNIALWHLQWRVDSLQSHIEEERLKEKHVLSGMIHGGS